GLYLVTVEADKLAKERNRQKILPLALLLEDDLREHGPGYVVTGLGVDDAEIFVGFDHLGEVFKRDVGAGAGVVESPVGILLYDGRLTRFRHGLTSPWARPAADLQAEAAHCSETRSFLRSMPSFSQVHTGADHVP